MLLNFKSNPRGEPSVSHQPKCRDLVIAYRRRTRGVYNKNKYGLTTILTLRINSIQIQNFKTNINMSVVALLL